MRNTPQPKLWSLSGFFAGINRDLEVKNIVSAMHVFRDHCGLNSMRGKCEAWFNQYAPPTLLVHTP